MNIFKLLFGSLLGAYKLEPILGSKENPHIYSDVTVDFKYFCSYEIENKFLSLAQGYREFHCQGELDWVLFKVSSKIWNDIFCFSSEIEGKNKIDDKTKIIYQLSVTKEQKDAEFKRLCGD